MGDADPVESGVVASLARPGRNVTGISLLGGALSAKRLELLREIVPAAKTIGVLINPENRNVAADRKELEAALTTTGQQAVFVPSGSSDDLEAAMAKFAQSRVDGLVVTADSIFINLRAQIITLAARYHIPAIYQWSLFVADGGLVRHGFERYIQASRAIHRSCSKR